MNNKRIFGIVVMLLVASMTIFAQTAARDLQTELKKFWPDNATYNQNVWNLAPIAVDQIVVRSVPGTPPIFTAYTGGREEHFSYVFTSSAEYDSEYYKQIHQSLPMVKGTICYYKSDYRTDEVFIGIVEDNRILDYGREHAKTDSVNGLVWIANKSDWTNLNEMAGDKFDFGVPIVEYKDDNGSRNSFRVSPDNIVHLYMVCHPVGNFMEAHRGQTLSEVKVGPLDKTGVKAVNIVNGFKNDYLYPFVIAFGFNDDKSEAYRAYRFSSGDLVIAQIGFFLRWQP